MSVRRRPEFRHLVAAFTGPASGHWGATDYFSRWLEACWSLLNAVVDRNGFRATLDTYSVEEGAEFARIFFERYMPLAEAADWQDVLGPIWMDLSGGRQGHGQTFTPWEVASCMAQVSVHDALPEIRRRHELGEVFTVCDPCCGSGVMLLAFADALRSVAGGTQYHDTIRYYGQDIDRRCVWMTRIQLRVNGLDAPGRSLRLASSFVPGKRAVDGPRLFSPVEPIRRAG